MPRIKFAEKSQVPDGEVRVFDANGHSIAVANLAGEYFALDNVCSHDGGALGEGTLFGDQVECPRHGARFDLRSGRVTVLPAVVPCRAYPVMIDGEELSVEIH
jgi:3-phenylpropionate/trans-cinnamate dioxygenase ferredoxin subunit